MKTMVIVAVSLLSMVASAMTDVETIASTLWMEARGEGCRGVDAVASVIVNRAKKSHKTAAYECLRPMQFSCWNGKTRTIPKASGAMWVYCKKVANSMVSGTFKVTNNATHYYNPSLCRPSWGKKMRDVVMVGNHRFGRC